MATFHVPELTHPDTVPLLVLASLLTDGHSARFYRHFVKSGRAGSISASVGSSFLNTDPSVFGLEAVANPGESGTDLESQIWAEMDRLQESGASSQASGQTMSRPPSPSMSPRPLPHW